MIKLVGGSQELILMSHLGKPPSVQFGSVQSLSHVRLFATPGTAARQAFQSITNSRSLLRLMSVALVMPSNRLIFCHPHINQRSFPFFTVLILPKCYYCSVAQSCPTLCNPRDCSTTAFPVHHQLPEPAQTHVHQDGDAIQPSYPPPPTSPAFNFSQHQDLFQWVSSSHQVAKVLELQLQHLSF